MLRRTFRWTAVKEISWKMTSPEEDIPTASKTCISSSWGLILAFTSGFLATANAFFVKDLGNQLSTGEITLFRCCGVLSFTLPHLILARAKRVDLDGHCLFLATMGFANGLSVFFQFLTFRYLSLGEAAALVSCYPVFVICAAKIFLRESLGVLQVVSFLTTIIGLILITGLYRTITGNTRVFATENIYGIAAGLTTAIAISVVFVMGRKLKDVHNSILTFTVGLFGIVESSIITAATSGFAFSCKGFQHWWIILIGLLSYISNLCAFGSVKYTEAGPATVMRSASDIFTSFVFQAFLYGSVPSGVTIVGAVLVCISIALIGLRQSLTAILVGKYWKFC